jgi:hypothetical protein
VRIRVDGSLTRRVAVDDSGLVATVHLCADGTCRLCPEQTPETIRAEIESQLVLANPDGDYAAPDWGAVAVAVEEFRPVLDAALCERAIPEFRTSRGVPADMAETSEVLPALAHLPLADQLGGSTAQLLAPVTVGGGDRPDDLDPKHGGETGRRAGHSSEGRWIVQQGWVRTGFLAAIILAATALVGLGGPVVYRTITAPPDGDGSSQDAGGATGDQQGAARPNTAQVDDQRRASRGRSGGAGGTAPTVTPSPGVFYATCAAAIAAGVAPILRGQPGYRPQLDADSDGIACDAALSDPGAGRGGPQPSPAPPSVSPTGGGADPTPAPPPDPPATTPPPAPTPTPEPTPEPTTDPPAGSDCILNAAGLCVGIGGGGGG